MSTKKLKGQLSKEEIIQLKKEYGDIYEIKTKDTVSYIKYPDRNIIRLVTPHIVRQEIYDMAELVLRNCHIAGEYIADNSYNVLGAMNLIDSIIQVKKSELKKL